MSTGDSPQLPTWRMRFLRHWRRRLIAFAISALVFFAFRDSILPTFAGVLIYDDDPAQCTRVAILDGDRRFDRAATMVVEGKAAGVLIIQTFPKRVEQAGIVGTSVARDQRELTKRGVRPEQMELVPGTARNIWEWARQIGAWLDEHPEATVIVLTEQFESRQHRIAMRQALSKEQLARIRIAALTHREYDPSNWWHNKDGGLAFGHSLLALAHVWIEGEHEPLPEPPSADELEASVP